MRLTVTFITGILLLFCNTGKLKAQTFTVSHSATFETATLQSMWGEDPSFNINDTINLFEEVTDKFTFDTRSGSIASFAGIKLGVGLWGGFQYGIGPLRFRISGFETGSIGVKYPIKVDLELPSDSTFNAGELVTINTSYTVEPGYELNTFYPAAGEIALELPLKFDLRVNVEFCLFSCFEVALIPPYPLVLPEPMLDVVYPIVKVNENEITYPCTSTIICTQPLSIPALEAGPVTGTLSIPNVSTTASLSGTDLVATGSDEYINISFDIIKFLGMLPTPAKPVFNAINGGISLPDPGIPDFSGDLKSIDISWSLFSMAFEVPISQSQEFIFSPTVVMEMSFPTKVDYEVTDPVTGSRRSGADSLVTLNVGHDITLRFPCDYSFMDMKANYEIEDENNFSNRTYDHVDVNFVVSALTFAVEFPEFTIIPRFCIPLGFTDICFELVIPGFSFGFGPLVGPYTLNLAAFDFPPYFDQKWSLGGLNKVDIPDPFRLTPRKFRLQLNSTPTLCYGDNTGTATLAVSGATAGYRYEWSNGATSQNLAAAKAGKHYITVTDANGCRAYSNVVIGEPSPILTATTGTNILCQGASTGDATVSTSGGTTPYSYSWFPSGASAASVSSIPAGLHRVTITDDNGCPKSDSIILTEPKAIRSAVSNIQEPSCNGFSDGSIILEVSGGAEPYSYSWSNGATTKNLLNLPAGNYNLLITDNNSCTKNTTALLNEPALLNTSLSLVRPVSCKGGNNGELLATPGGGTAPYSFKWLNNAVTLSERTGQIRNLKASAYSIEVTDKNNCIATNAISITEPSEVLTVTLSPTHVVCYGNSDGSVNATILGGTAPYALLWSNGATGNPISNVTAGKYSVTIADANGCPAKSQTLITQPARISVFAKATDISCSDQQDGKVSVENIVGGAQPYSYQWSNGNNTASMNDLAEGTYDVEITDQKGCIGNATVVVNKKEGKCLFIPNAFSPNNDGINDTWVIRNIHLYPNSKVTIVNKWGETIYTSSPYHTPWDGRRNGVLMPLATYFYILDLGNGESEYTGPLTIIK